MMFKFFRKQRQNKQGETPFFNKSVNFLLILLGLLLVFNTISAFAAYTQRDYTYDSTTGRYKLNNIEDSGASPSDYYIDADKYNSLAAGTPTAEETAESIVNSNSGDMAGSNLKRFLDIFNQKAKKIADTVHAAALDLFWALAFIQFTWSAIMLSRRGEFGFGNFLELLIKETMFIGFFYFLLVNGLDLSNWIIGNGLEKLGVAASGVELDPTKIISNGLTLAWEIIWNSGFWDKIGAVFAGGIIAIAFALIAAQAAVCLVKASLVAPAGVLLLGLGGSLWTKQYAENYIRTLISIGMEIFCLQIIVAVTNSFVEDLSNISNFLDGGNNLALAGIAIVIYMLAKEIPQFASAMVTGSTFGGGSSMVGAMAAMGAMAGRAINIASGGATAGASMAGKLAGGASDAANMIKEHTLGGNGGGNFSAGDVGKIAGAGTKGGFDQALQDASSKPLAGQDKRGGDTVGAAPNGEQPKGTGTNTQQKSADATSKPETPESDEAPKTQTADGHLSNEQKETAAAMKEAAKEDTGFDPDKKTANTEAAPGAQTQQQGVANAAAAQQQEQDMNVRNLKADTVEAKEFKQTDTADKESAAKESGGTENVSNAADTTGGENTGVKTAASGNPTDLSDKDYNQLRKQWGGADVNKLAQSDGSLRQNLSGLGAGQRAKVAGAIAWGAFKTAVGAAGAGGTSHQTNKGIDVLVKEMHQGNEMQMQMLKTLQKMAGDNGETENTMSPGNVDKGSKLS